MNDETENTSDEVTSHAERTNRKDELAISPDVGDRPRGILSEADRKYLCGLKDYAHAQTESNRKQDIRKRVINGLKDFGVLWYFLDPAERKKIFNELGTEDTNLCIESMIAFVYLGIDQDRPRLEERIEHGVIRGSNLEKDGREVGGAKDADVSINIDFGPDVDKLHKKLQEGKTDQLTSSEIGALVQAGKLDSDDLKRFEKDNSGFPELSLKGNTENQSSSEHENEE